MGKRLSDAEIAPVRSAMSKLRLLRALIGLAVLIAVAGCNAAGYQQWQGDDAGPTHNDTGGGDGGGSM